MLVRCPNIKSIGCVKTLAAFISFFFGCLFLSGPTEAIRLETTWGERVDLSEKIVRGKVVAMKSYWNPQNTLINTDVIVLVDEYLKGNGPREVVIKIPGGTVDRQTQSVSDVPQFATGNYYVIFLNSSGSVTGGPDGLYTFREKDGDAFLVWLRAYIEGDPKAPKEGPAVSPRLQSK